MPRIISQVSDNGCSKAIFIWYRPIMARARRATYKDEVLAAVREQYLPIVPVPSTRRFFTFRRQSPIGIRWNCRFEAMQKPNPRAEDSGEIDEFLHFSTRGTSMRCKFHPLLVRTVPICTFKADTWSYIQQCNIISKLDSRLNEWSFWRLGIE